LLLKLEHLSDHEAPIASPVPALGFDARLREPHPRFRNSGLACQRGDLAVDD
jgi:hypothetical protein